MDFSFTSNALVIVANQHNPTVISENFLIDSEIIGSAKEIDKNNLIITPAISQVYLNDGTKISVEPHKMTIHQEKIGESVFNIGQKYCEQLPHIKCTAIGINFEVALDENFDITDWFSKCNFVDYKNNQINGIDFEFDVNEEKGFKCNTKVFKDDNALGRLRFNYHHPLSEATLKDVAKDLNLKEKWKEYLEYCKEFTNRLFDN